MAIFGVEGGVDKVEGADVLVVLLHAFAQTPASLNRVAFAVREAIPSSDLYAPRLPPRWYAVADPDKIVGEVALGIQRLDEDRRREPGAAPYRELIVVGHSAGAVLARSLVAQATLQQASDGATADPVPRWSDRITRVVLLAATNRGWMVSSALDPIRRLLWTLGSAIGHLMRHALGLEPYIFGFRRGAPFLTSTRLQWLEATRHRREMGKEMPVTVQLIGTDDDYVAPTDNLDLATGLEFVYLEVARATHLGIVSLDQGDGGEDAKQKFQLALKADPAELHELSLKREDIFELFEESTDDHDATNVPRADLGASHVAFVIHGIRDRGFWTKRIARHVKAYAHEKGLRCRCVTSTYGYFPMGPFLLPWVRRAKVEWLLDQYVTAKALYPDAAFAYVGHSNGTYLLARALELCPEVRFRRVVFAGSVVSDGYDWQRFLPGRGGAQGRIEAFVNYVATGDWVVAISPNGLRRLRLQTDLGGAGHNGFDDGVDRLGPAFGLSPTEPVVDIKYMPGGHSAALTVENWNDIARFVIDKRPTPPVAAQAVHKLNPRVASFGEWSWAIWLALAAFFVGVPCGLLWWIGHPDWLIALLLVACLEVFRTLLTKA